MGSPASVTTENSEPRRQGRFDSEGTPKAVIDVVGTAYSDERPSPDSWLSEVPPTGVPMGLLGELSFYYGACWLYHLLAQRLGKTR